MNTIKLMGKSYKQDYLEITFNPKNIVLSSCVDGVGSDFVITRDELRKELGKTNE